MAARACVGGHARALGGRCCRTAQAVAPVPPAPRGAHCAAARRAPRLPLLPPRPLTRTVAHAFFRHHAPALMAASAPDEQPQQPLQPQQPHQPQQPLPVRLGLAVCGVSLLNALSLALAWMLRSDAWVVLLSATSLALCAPLVADVAWRAGAAAVAEQTHCSLHPNPLQLTLDTACCVLVAVQALEGLGWLVFTHSGAAGVVRAVLPVACCAWVCRLGVASPLWAEHAAALDAREARIAAAAAEGTARRLLDGTAGATGGELSAAWRGAGEVLSASSGRLFHRLTTVLSVLDWALLGALWYAMEPAAGAAFADAAAAAWFLPALLALDGARVGAQLLHATTATSGSGAAGAAPASWLLPAGIVSRLSGGLFSMNVGCSVALLALVRHGDATGGWALLPRCVLAARFLRLICECAYLAAGAESPLPRPTQAQLLRAAAQTAAAAPPPPPLDAPLASGSDPWPLRMARALYTDGSSVMTSWLSSMPPAAAASPPPPASSLPAAPLPPPTAAPPARLSPRISLDAFSSLVAAGVRGHLRGEEAAAAVARVFSEADEDASGNVTTDEIGSWVAREPADGGGVKWRASVRRVLTSLPSLAPLPPPPAAEALPVPLPPPLTAALPSLPRYRPRGLRLLSLEGGGIKGLALIWQLQAIERATGRPIHDLFDLIGGTSTGGILALALVNRVSLARLVRRLVLQCSA
jgi:hypothetical protein